MHSRIWTIEDLLSERCEEVGDCIEWQGSLNSGGHPIMRYRGSAALVRRVTWVLSHGQSLEDIRGKFIWATCCNDLCVKPGHARIGTTKQMAAWMSRAGLTAATPAKVAACILNKRAQSNLDMDKVRQIRRRLENGEGRGALAEEFRKSRSAIDLIATGKTWRESIVGASIFSMGAA